MEDGQVRDMHVANHHARSEAKARVLPQAEIGS
jgi:hypothetical protein